MPASASSLRGKPGYRLKGPVVPHSRDQEIAVWDYFQRNGPGREPMEQLIVAIDSRLPYWGPESVRIRERALTEMLARLQLLFDSEQNWEMEAVCFLTKIEGQKWMVDQFVQDEPHADRIQTEYRPPGYGSDDIKPLPDKDYPDSGAIPDHNLWNMTLSTETVRKVGIAVVVVVLPITLWHHRARFLTGA